MRIALEGKDKLGFIDGSYVKPAEDSADLKQWKINDSLVRTWIRSTMTKDIANAFLYVSSARTLCNKAKSEEIEENQLMQFLMGLSEPYDSIRSQILVLDPLPSHKVFQKRKVPLEKRNMVCEHCCKPGHNKETCFKLHGVSEWYRDLNEQKKRGMINNNRAYAATQNFEDENAQRTDIVSELMEALKLIQTKVPQDPIRVHLAHDIKMAGPDD
ncbi:UNVERIFIED_CONTAM: hypothetical protein Sangu_1186700 [Sesamum angustifolium]|uniref:Retrotransposon Copia-like N-terminal domain-containing protein n=1 Tax=Sesamum angustifolium TaxID=2727405 RepID=A0AAW2NID7_9LAMI